MNNALSYVEVKNCRMSGQNRQNYFVEI